MKFDLSTQAFSAANCAASVQASALAYRQTGESYAAWQDRVASTLHAAGFEVVEFLLAPRTDTQGFMAANASMVLIAFQGSCSIRDWITDLDARKRELIWMDMEIHEGFGLAYQSIREQLTTFLLAHHGKPIILSGHSLGGALAMLCAFDIHGLAHLHNVYTFGQPRVGDSRFAKCFDAELKAIHFRLVNNLDIVPRSPGKLMGYTHAGIEIFIDALGFQHVDLQWWQKLPSDALAIAEDWTRQRLDAVRDHFIADYVRLLPEPASAPAFALGLKEPNANLSNN